MIPKQKQPAQAKAAKPKLQQKVRREASSLKSNLQVSVPVASGNIRRVNKPVLKPGADGDVTVTHREYIADLLGSVAFANTQYSVNPGLSGTFPWLSAIAQRYESYLFEYLHFEYETQAATSTTGTVITSLDYDASDAAPTTKSQALAYRASVRSPAWAGHKHTSLPEDIHKRKSYYVRAGALAANQDVKLYDCADANFSTQGQASAAAVGELYVEYRVRLMTPQIGSVGVGEAAWGSFSGTSNAAPFATVDSGNLPATVVSSGTTTSISTWTFTQPWQGVVAIEANGSGITAFAPSGTATSSEDFEVISSGATAGAEICFLAANIGQTFIVTISNTTLNPTQAIFAQAGL